MKTNNDNYNSSLKYSFSLDQLNKIGNNDEEFTTEMLKQFEHSARECSEELVLAIKQNDLAKVKRSAHKAVPSYSVMNLVELTGLLKKIEALEMSGEDLKELVNLFDKKNQRVLFEIDHYIKEKIKIPV